MRYNAEVLSEHMTDKDLIELVEKAEKHNIKPEVLETKDGASELKYELARLLAFIYEAGWTDGYQARIGK